MTSDQSSIRNDPFTEYTEALGIRADKGHMPQERPGSGIDSGSGGTHVVSGYGKPNAGRYLVCLAAGSCILGVSLLNPDGVAVALPLGMAAAIAAISIRSRTKRRRAVG